MLFVSATHKIPGPCGLSASLAIYTHTLVIFSRNTAANTAQINVKTTELLIL